MNRPHIICHMMMTLDGKITSGDGTDILDTYFDLYTKTEDMLPPHTAWMCGRVTMQMFASDSTEALPTPTQEIDAKDVIAPHSAQSYMFGVDTKGQLRWKGNTIQLSNVKEALHLVVIVTKATAKAYLAYLREMGISYIVSGNEAIDFESLFERIKTAFGVSTLLLEGGGLLNGSVMAAGYVDELSLLVTPVVLNKSSAPSSFEQKVVPNIDIKHYALTDVKRMEKDCVWMRYTKN